MRDPVVSCVVYAFDMLIVYIFFSRIVEKRFSTGKCVLLGLILFELGSAVNLVFRNNALINSVVSAVTYFCFGVWCFKLRPFQAAGYAVCLTVLNFALEVGSILLFSALTRTELTAYNTNLALLIVECSSCKALLFLTCLILSGFSVPNARWSKHQLSLLLFPVLSNICLAIFWYICLQDGITPRIQYLLAFASLLFFGSTVLLFMIYQHEMEIDGERMRMKSENERLLTEKSYYDILDQQNQQLMAYAHDAKNHLAAIQSINTDPAIERYIEALSDQLKTYTSNCHSGNMMLDVMINKYVLECERRSIRFDYYVRSCNLKDVEDIDLVAILGNLMDNALTAAAQSEKRFVSLETTMRNGYSVIVISNGCDTAPETREGRLVTAKEDKKLHGYGLKSVYKTLKRYHGDYSWEYSEPENTFVVTVMIGSPQ